MGLDADKETRVKVRVGYKTKTMFHKTGILFSGLSLKVSIQCPSIPSTDLDE